VKGCAGKAALDGHATVCNLTHTFGHGHTTQVCYPSLTVSITKSTSPVAAPLSYRYWLFHCPSRFCCTQWMRAIKEPLHACVRIPVMQPQSLMRHADEHPPARRTGRRPGAGRALQRRLNWRGRRLHRRQPPSATAPFAPARTTALFSQAQAPLQAAAQGRLAARVGARPHCSGEDGAVRIWSSAAGAACARPASSACRALAAGRPAGRCRAMTVDWTPPARFPQRQQRPAFVGAPGRQGPLSARADAWLWQPTPGPHP
jgi:hypothetical protein